MSNVVECPYCHHCLDIVKFGKSWDGKRQRYACKACSKTWTEEEV